MHFLKYHGSGNDFIFIERGNLTEGELPELVRRICHRRFGVGADGLMLAEDSAAADIRMRYFNQDGSEAPMCGNGIRAFARYITEQGLMDKKAFQVETLAGLMAVEIKQAFSEIAVDLGAPRYGLSAAEARGSGCVTLPAGGEAFELDLLFLGTLHAVVFAGTGIPEDQASALCHHEFFPGDINVNFVEVVDEEHLRVRTYERGVGFTLACGTGSAAAQTIAHDKGFTKETAFIETDGGTLTVQAGERVILTGPAVRTAEGEFFYE